MDEMFRLITPTTYWLLIALWSFILWFYLAKIRAGKTNWLLRTLILILALDAFRTLFESIYFGTWYTSLSGLIPPEIGSLLTRPELVIIPKLVNIATAVIIIVLLVKKWLPREEEEQLRLEGALREREEEFRSLFENNPVSCWLEDLSEIKGYFDEIRASGVSEIEPYFLKHPKSISECLQLIRIKDVNQATLDLHGAKSKEELFQGLKETFTVESFKVFQKLLVDVWHGKNQFTYDTVMQTLAGQVRYVTSNCKVASGHEKSLSSVLITVSDITAKTVAEQQQRELKKQLLQSQKMEAIGTLAGGIAHDFNNILTAILGYAELAREDSPDHSSVAGDLDQVIRAGNRAKGLVQQILAFSRQAETERIPCRPAEIIREAIDILRPSSLATIAINQDIDSTTGLIFADPAQLNQIVMNLCTNALHAMEETGGSLDISLKEKYLGRDELADRTTLRPGSFVQLSVADSGSAIPPEIRDKIFEPYFTTKGLGRGTGMGLSIVHGIVKSYGGFISFTSNPGQGTTFDVFFPVSQEKALPETATIEEMPTGRERILFIDDERILAELGKSTLEGLGYQVTASTDSLEALRTFQDRHDQFDLVITDQTMPGMTGAEIAKKMLQIRNNIPIILCTGYSTLISEEEAITFGVKEFALKPLNKKNLALLIRKVLDVCKEAGATMEPLTPLRKEHTL